MKIRKAYKFRLKTNARLEKILWYYAGNCRFIWNYFWRLNHSRLQNKQQIMYYREMDFWSKYLKKSEEYKFLSDTPAHLLQQKLRDLEKAYKDGFDVKQPNKRLPKKRKRSLHNSFRYPDAKQFEINNRRIWLPKIGWVGFYKSRDIVGVPKNITISYKAGFWYISIQVEQEGQPLQAANDSCVGIDLGVVNFATIATSKGSKAYEPKNSYKLAQARLAKEQKTLARKQNKSKNFFKQRLKIQKLHARITNIRKNHLHEISNEICKNHTVIFIEDLKVINMSKSAKGNKEKPGKSVKAKSGLNKSILDQGWVEFRRQLEYKSYWRDGSVIAIDPKYTSQRCSNCGHKSKENRKTQAVFLCQNCDFEINADVNAANNILAAGLSCVGL